MPVNFSEPISVLQRVTEDLEYADLLEAAAKLVSDTFFSVSNSSISVNTRANVLCGSIRGK